MEFVYWFIQTVAEAVIRHGVSKVLDYFCSSGVDSSNSVLRNAIPQQVFADLLGNFFLRL